MTDSRLTQLGLLVADARKLAEELAGDEPSVQDRCDLFTLRRYLFWCGERVAVMEARP